MAQLPPKIPPSAMIPNHNCSWPPPAAFLLPSATEAPPQPSWVDEFLHLSAARRIHHRRSVSDSVAFLDDPASEFDADQLLSIFSEDVVAPAPSSSVPSDHNSANGDDDDKTAAQKPIANEAEEAQSAWQAGTPQPSAGADTAIVDPKRVKRILANRQSAQRSRVRKLQYISELERSVTTLQSEVSALSPRVTFLDQQRSLLTLGNSHLKQRIAALAQDKIFKDAHQEALKKEIDRLRHVYQQQNLTTIPPPPPPPPPPTAEPTVVSTEKELVTR